MQLKQITIRFTLLTLRHSRKMRTPKRGAHFFVAAEAEKRDEPLRHKVNLSKDKFPIYAFINVCANDMLPQGSAACEARRFRLFLRLIKGTKSAETLYLFGVMTLWRTSLRHCMSRRDSYPWLTRVVR